MALPTGTISTADINTEIGRPATYANTNLNENLVRLAAASVSGTGILVNNSTIAMSNLQGANATQVINNVVGALTNFTVSPYGSFSSYGVKTINTSNFGSANIGGTMPSNTLTIAGGGNASVANLYYAPFLSGPNTYLDLTGSPTYTGSFNIWISTNPSDTWPSTFLCTMTYGGAVSYSGGTAYRWGYAGSGSGNLSDLQYMRSFRIAKA